MLPCVQSGWSTYINIFYLVAGTHPDLALGLRHFESCTVDDARLEERPLGSLPTAVTKKMSIIKINYTKNCSIVYSYSRNSD